MISMNSTLGQKRKAMQLEKESLEFGVFGAHEWKRTQCHPGECASLLLCLAGRAKSAGDCLAIPSRFQKAAAGDQGPLS